MTSSKMQSSTLSQSLSLSVCKIGEPVSDEGEELLPSKSSSLPAKDFVEKRSVSNNKDSLALILNSK